MAEVAEKAKEAYGVAAEFVESQISPRVKVYADQAKVVGEETGAELSSEGMLTKEAVEESFAAAKSQAESVMKEPHPFVMNTVIGEVPFMDKIPNAKIGPTVPTASFIFWNIICLLLGYADVTLFALYHTMKDSFTDVSLYFPMYVLKLGVDLAVCTAVAYGIYFTFVKSASTKMKHAALGFLAFVTVKCLLVFYAYFNLLALVEAIANAVLLLRAYILWKASTAVDAPKEDGDTVVVDVPTAKYTAPKEMV